MDDPKTQDNREYQYSGTREHLRPEYHAVLEWVTPGARVLDLGCGQGTLLALLRDKKGCLGTGVEISKSGAEITSRKGFETLHKSIDAGLSEFKDKSFDFAICNVTLQMILKPEMAVSEMKRVAKRLIISFPNFAYFRNRFDLVFGGRMPRPMLYGYQWYNTGHIHQFSLLDFERLATVLGLRVIRFKEVGSDSFFARKLIRYWPNLFSRTCILELEPFEPTVGRS